LVEGYTDVVSLHQAGIENVVASGGTSLTIDQLRLIKKYTNNLTIIYDGDNAGIKAALRGLEMALEESLNVKLVLIPDGEDPDSYVNKVGTTAFQQFIAANKKDFIIFQLEVMMKEAGNDVSRKSEVVNQVAETLSKINKAEDFIKQQGYVKQCAEILKIDEGGLTNLVNKYKRDRISKEEKRLPFEETNHLLQDNKQHENYVDDNVALINEDEQHERNVLRVLLEYGLNKWNEEKSIADFIFEELEAFHFDNKDLEVILNTYKDSYHNNQKPTTKSFLYSNDKNMADLVVALTMFPFELSQNWDTVLEGMNITTRDVSHNDVQMSVNYFKLKKLKKMFLQNQADIEKSKNFEEQKQLLEVHKNLKEIEREITKQIGTVIFK